MKRYSKIGAMVLMVLLITTSAGCKLDTSQLLHPDSKDKQVELIKVQINFTDGENIIGYVQNLGIGNNAKVYAGGTSVNYIYDRNGNVIGCFNYQRVLYMKILQENINN